MDIFLHGGLYKYFYRQPKTIWSQDHEAILDLGQNLYVFY